MVSAGLLPVEEGSTVQIVIEAIDIPSGRQTICRGLALVLDVIQEDEVLELEVDVATIRPRSGRLDGGLQPWATGRFVLLGCPRRRAGSGLPAWRPVARTSPRVIPRS